MAEEHARVSRITAARLHNCGNYEHVRYEITVDLAPTDKPSDILTQLERVLADLKPARDGYDYELRQARTILAKPAQDLSEMELRNMPVYRERVRLADEAIEKRRLAAQALNAFGGSAVYTDAKSKWDDEDRY